MVIALAVVFASMRAVGMLGPSSLRRLLPLGFVLMAAMPWLLLNREGRRQIGLVTPRCNADFILAVALGALSAIACFVIGFALFGNGKGNWFMSIANNYRDVVDTSGFSVLKLHLFFTVPALIFSPVAEEIFFRGLLQRALEGRFSNRVSTMVECAAVGGVHLCHHGLLWNASGVTLLPYSGALWVGLIFRLGCCLPG